MLCQGPKSFDALAINLTRRAGPDDRFERRLGIRATGKGAEDRQVDA